MSRPVGRAELLGIGGIAGANDFFLVRAFEIMRFSEHGRVVESLGFVMNDKSIEGVPDTPSLEDLRSGKKVIAKSEVLVLTNGHEVHRVVEPLVILDDDICKSEKKAQILAGLAPEERQLLGL